ncbi:Hpt domain-containing protein [Sulfitobacter sp. F26204]|uniref:Hpt domain-containing protein n=1 Tax=Sulfitobacter sp. F26204 TaxID=2996014 RepID=UPI00225DD99A|nr:Hpt domain-containing protein [Sulfitobacter sp. F26204]MCX7560205.1 Hpt domain-containing protein [Sulfitobacter sp. F26204]
MKDMIDTLPGIERIRTRFLTMLKTRQGDIASHALSAWETTDVDAFRDHLAAAQGILHQIAGSAGSLNFGTLGTAARQCENDILGFLESDESATATVPGEIMESLDTFVSLSQALLDENSKD